MKDLMLKIIIISTIIVIQSCGLSNQSIFDQVGNIEEIDYNEGSALYKTSITGIAYKNGFLYVTASVNRLLRKSDLSKNWESVNTPNGYQARDIVEINNTVYVILSSSSNFVVAEINESGEIVNTKKPIEKNFSRLLKLQNSSGDMKSAIISATTSTGTGEKFFYSLDGLNITPSFNNEESIKDVEIKGSLLKSPEYFLSFNSIKESNQIHKKGMDPITVEKPEGKILFYATGQIKFDGQETDVIASGGGALYKIDLTNGKVNLTPVVTSTFSTSYMIPSCISIIDDTFVVATNTGYFEVSESEGKKKLTFPKETTDASHYNAIKMGKIQSIYKINKKYYIATEGYGLWERDEADNKKWKAL